MSRSQRRANAERIRKNRADILECVWNRELSDKERAMLKKNNFACGCKMCKPHKHFGNNSARGEFKMKHGDRKRSEN